MAKGLVRYQKCEVFHFLTLSCRVAKGTITGWSCDPTASGFQTVTDYALGLGNQQVTEVGVNGSSLAWQHTNVWTPGGQLIATFNAAESGTAALHFYFDDPLGTRRVQTNAIGVIEQQCTSLPFGDQESCIPMPTEQLFTGKERDAESGNDYFGARYYASSMGRFMSPDPLGNQVADFSNPQTWNMYSYALNNPLRYVDPTGTDWCAWDDGTHDPDPKGPDGGGGDVVSNKEDCEKAGGTWIPTVDQSVTVNGDTGESSYTSDIWVTPTIQPQQQSYWGCVRSGLQDFSLQSGLQNISGGKLGNGWLAGAFLGNSVQSVGDTISAVANGKPGSAANIAAAEGTSWAAAPAATAVASKVPNVAVSVGVQVAATVQTPTATTTVSLSAQAAADLPLGTAAQAGAGVLSKTLGALGTFKLPYDLSVASFSAVVCGIGR
jgi:RHS repeat-associated protein